MECGGRAVADCRAVVGGGKKWRTNGNWWDVSGNGWDTDGNGLRGDGAEFSGVGGKRTAPPSVMAGVYLDLGLIFRGPGGFPP